MGVTAALSNSNMNLFTFTPPSLLFCSICRYRILQH